MTSPAIFQVKRRRCDQRNDPNSKIPYQRDQGEVDKNDWVVKKQIDYKSRVLFLIRKWLIFFAANDLQIKDKSKKGSKMGMFNRQCKVNQVIGE